jgi:hypothetical protein
MYAVPAAAAACCQAMRLTLVQVLMNSKGYNMNPLQSLYYVSPACFISLLLPFREWRAGSLQLAVCKCRQHAARRSCISLCSTSLNCQLTSSICMQMRWSSCYTASYAAAPSGSSTLTATC